MTAPLTVDVTGWFIAALDAALTARVGAETPADLETQVPFLRVLRIGGPDDGVILDEPTMAFHGFAASQKAANQLCYETKAAVYALRGVVRSGAVLTIARTLSGPSWADVTNQNLAHAVLLMQARIMTTG
jgi:hypothetical protein